MTRFITGDELGNLKTLRYSLDDVTGEHKAEVKIIHDGIRDKGGPNGIQALSVSSIPSGSVLLATARANGLGSVISLQEDDTLEVLQEWKDARLKPDQQFIGLALSEKSVYTCSNNGALQRTPLHEDNEHAEPHQGTLPTRLCDWRLSPDQLTFAYGGDEVELSVWNVEQAFSHSEEASDSTVSTKKRKRKNDALFPGEVWRARNVPNDYLGLRQPVRVTSLTYLASSPTASQHHILAGTQLGDVRRYDAQSGRRPVCNWKGIGRVGGVKGMEKGLNEYEVFISDYGSNLSAIDLRNGRTLYSYQGLSGAVTSIAPAPFVLASTSLDRFTRIHSTFPPPSQAGQRQDHKGDVINKTFMKSTPNVVVWDRSLFQGSQNDSENGDDLWESLPQQADGD